MEAIDLTADSATSGPVLVPGPEMALPTLQPLAVSTADGAIQSMYEAHFRSIFRYALLSTGRPADAEDIVADTFARALVALRSGHEPAGPPLPWLLLICRRIVTDRWRRRRLIGWLPLGGRAQPGNGRDDAADVDVGSDDKAMAASEFWLWLDAVTRALPERQRAVLFLRYERDLTDEQIGDVLGLTASGVRSLTARAIASLRQHPELLR